MSEQKEKIITGLRLSEAIKYCEDNDKVLIKPDEHAGYASHYEFAPPDRFQMITSYTWTVKLPPPKTVSVTRADIEKAFYAQNLSILSNAGILDALCKDLGL